LLRIGPDFYGMKVDRLFRFVGTPGEIYIYPSLPGEIVLYSNPRPGGGVRE